MKSPNPAPLHLVLAALCVITPMAHAQSPAQPATPVHLEVTADGPLQQSVTSCLTEELKAVPGVAVNDGAEALTLAVIVVEQKMSDGQMIGYLTYEGGYMPGPQCQSKAAEQGSRPVVVYWQSLRMYPPDLKKACQRIVDAFKIEVVEPIREAQRGLAGQKGAR